MGIYTGSRSFQVEDDQDHISFPVWVLYPTHTPSLEIPFGPFVMNVSPDAPVAGGNFPLVIISHGSGGSPLLYRAIAAHLSKNGYIVALPEHPG